MFAVPVPYVSLQAPQLTFVGVSSLITSTGVITWPIDTAADDFAIMIGVGATNLSETGYTSGNASVFAPGGHRTSWMYKTLVSGDISSPPSVTIPSYGAFHILVYNGPTAATLKTEASSLGSGITVAGFTRAANSKGVIAAMHDRDPIGTLPAPDGFTRRNSDTSTYFSYMVSDLKSNFYDEKSVAMEAFAGSHEAQGLLLELT